MIALTKPVVIFFIWFFRWLLFPLSSKLMLLSDAKISNKLWWWILRHPLPLVWWPRALTNWPTIPRSVGLANHLLLYHCLFKYSLTPRLLAYLAARLSNLLDPKLRPTRRGVLTVGILITLGTLVTSCTGVLISEKDTKLGKLHLDLVMLLSPPPHLHYRWILLPDPSFPRQLMLTPALWAT